MTRISICRLWPTYLETFFLLSNVTIFIKVDLEIM